MQRQSIFSSPQIKTVLRSKSKGISLSSNNFASNQHQEVININVYVESVSLKQPKININCIWNQENAAKRIKTCNDEQTYYHAESVTRTTQRRNPLTNKYANINNSVYLNSSVRQQSPGISLSLLQRKHNTSQKNQEKIQYKRKSISIQNSRLFQAKMKQQTNITQTPIRRLKPANVSQPTGKRKQIFRQTNNRSLI